MSNTHAGCVSLTVPSHPVGKHGWRREGGDRRIRQSEGTVRTLATFVVNNNVI